MASNKENEGVCKALTPQFKLPKRPSPSSIFDLSSLPHSVIFHRSRTPIASRSA